MVYASVGRPSVRLSVCPGMGHGSKRHSTAAKFAAVARPTGDINRLLHGVQSGGVRRPNAGSAALSTEHRLIISRIDLAALLGRY